MSRKQLYIHIGMPKTGSTAIQKFLSANFHYLLKQGVLYPEFVRVRHHNYNHADLFLEYSPELGIMVNKNHEDIEIFSMKKEFEKEVEKFSPKKIILSTEDIFIGVQPKQWKLIKALCSGYEVFLVVYLRRQDDFLISFYNQSVKGSSKTKLPLLSLLKQEEWLYSSYDYENVLSAWSDIVGDDHIMVAPYEGEIRSDIVSHFLQSVGIEDSIAMARPENRENISIPYTFIKLKRLMNSAAKEGPLPYQASDFMRLAKELNTLRANDGRKVSDPSPLSPQRRREIIAQYEKVNQRIAQRYLGKEKLFEAPLPCDNEPFDETVTLSREECSEVLAVLVADYMETRCTLDALGNSYHELHNQYQSIVWLRIFNARKVLSFLKRKLFSAAARLKRSVA